MIKAPLNTSDKLILMYIEEKIVKLFAHIARRSEINQGTQVDFSEIFLSTAHTSFVYLALISLILHFEISLQWGKKTANILRLIYSQFYLRTASLMEEL